MRTMLLHKFRLLLVLGAVLSLVVAACGGGEDEAAPTATTAPGAPAARPTAAPAPTSTAAPVSTGELTMTLPTIDFALLPFPGSSSCSRPHCNALYDDIVAIGRPDISPDTRKMDYKKGFATVITANADSTVWTVKTRKGVRFHNGDEATAKDAAYSSGLMLTKDNQIPTGSTFARLLTKLETPDDETVVYTLNRTSLFFPYVFLANGSSSQVHWVLPEKYHQSIGGWLEATKKPVGSGPYKFKSITVGDRIIVEAVDRHWFYGVPRIKTISFVAIPEEATRLALLKTGESDFAPISGVTLGAAKAANLRVYLVAGPASWVQVIPSAIDRPLLGGPNPLSSDDVRKALAWYAIDRPALVKSFFPDTGILTMDSPINPSDAAYDPSKKAVIPAFDPNKARALLAQAGYPRGFELDVLKYSAPSPTYDEAFEAVFVWWEQIGIKVNRGPTDTGAARLRATAGIKNGYSKATVLPGTGTWAPVAAEVYAAQPHNPEGFTFTTEDPEAVRLGQVWRAAPTLDAYAKAGQAYHSYVFEHAKNWWPLLAFRPVSAGSQKLPASWQDSVSGGTSGEDFVAAAAGR